MYEIQTRVETVFASKYLQQLCKHFAHKVDVVYDPYYGDVQFPFGHCVMAATDTELLIKCRSGEENHLIRARFVIDDHLERFAWKEKLKLKWHSTEQESQSVQNS